MLSKIFTQCPLEQFAKPSALTLIFLSSLSEQWNERLQQSPQISGEINLVNYKHLLTLKWAGMRNLRLVSFFWQTHKSHFPSCHRRRGKLLGCPGRRSCSVGDKHSLRIWAAERHNGFGSSLLRQELLQWGKALLESRTCRWGLWSPKGFYPLLSQEVLWGCAWTMTFSWLKKKDEEYPALCPHDSSKGQSNNLRNCDLFFLTL